MLVGVACQQTAAGDPSSREAEQEQDVKAAPKIVASKPQKEKAPARSQTTKQAAVSKDEPSARSKKTPKLATLRVGASGPKIKALRSDLAKLGYWTGGAEKSYGPLLEQAVLAFQGAEGLVRDGIAGPKTRGALATAERPTARSRAGSLIEVNKDKQLLYVVRNGETKWAIHISSGTNEPYEHPNGSTYKADTASGRYKIYSQFSEGWHKSPLGKLWRPKFFNRDGIALHGFQSVPPYPASHGCVRMSIEAMDFLWRADLAPMHSRVWVY